MNLDFFENFLKRLNMPKKADPDKVHRHHVRSRKINIRPKLIIIAFAIVIVLLVAVSAVTVIKERDTSQSETSVTGETLESSALPVFDEAQEDFFSGNILLAFTRDGNDDLHFLAVVNFDGSGDGIKVSYIPVSTVCKVNNINGTMKEHLQNGGIIELLWAVGERYSIGIEKYVLCDEENFIDIMKSLGDTEITIDEQISFDYNGLSFIIEKGKQVFTPDTMLKYYLYLCSELWDQTNNLTNITASIAKRIADFENSTVEERYNSFINFVSSDLSAMDIRNFEKAIYNIFKNGTIDKIEIVNDPSIFNTINK